MDFPTVEFVVIITKVALRPPHLAEVLRGVAAAHLPVATIMAAAVLPEVQPGHPVGIPSKVRSTVEQVVLPTQFRVLQVAGAK